MYLCDYSLDNLSMMALILALGFVVDDAIVVLENIVRHMENGVPPMRAAFEGAREVSFTIVSMTISLASVFIPLLFMGGILGRLFRENKERQHEHGKTMAERIGQAAVIET